MCFTGSMPAHFTPPERDHAGEFRSKLVGGNGEIVTASEGYTSDADVYRWVDGMVRWVIEARDAQVRAALTEALAPLVPSGVDAAVEACIARLTAIE